jgi:uncharacterized protein YdhG (YjbR/CyaY superfamily)
MRKGQVAPRNIDEYIAEFPPEVQAKLQRIRAAIKKAAPKAEEAIKYSMPTFVLNGNLVHFAGYKNHIGFYPAPRALQQFREELSKYEGSKGAVRFPLDKPVPIGLIQRMVKFRVASMAQAQAKKKQSLR